MTTPQEINVSNLIDDCSIGKFNIAIVLWGMFILLFDGYDIGVLAFAAPELIKAWNVTDRSALGPVFSASIIGILFGAIVFGYIGDRFGRRVAIITSCLAFGVTTLGACFATSLQELFYLRLLTGFGLGGLFPNISAMSSEYAPKRYRATLVIITLTGVTFGTALPGLVQINLMPIYGWKVLFLIGGVGPLLVAVACYLWMPESAKFLALHPERWGELRKLVKKLRPDIALTPDTRFTITETRQYSGISPVNLFKNGLAPITALLWLCFAANLMGYFFLINWLPTVLQSANLTGSEAAVATMLLQFGGVTGGWLLCRPMDNTGPLPIIVLFIIAMVMVASIGSIGGYGVLAVQVTVFFAGLSVLALQYGLDAMSAIIYPTSIRSVGSGWAFAAGRIGSIFGPIIGGILVARNMPIDKIFLFAAIPFVVGAVAATCLLLVYRRKFGGLSMQAGAPSGP